MDLPEPIGFINWKEYHLNIQVTEELIKKTIIQVMEEITFYPESVRKRKVSQTEEEIIQQISPQKRINNRSHNEVTINKRSDGKDYEKALCNTMNRAGFKPIRTSNPDRGIDVIGEYKGVTIYAQAKDWQNKVTAEKIQQLEGVLVNKQQSIGVMVSRNGYTKDAVDYARASTVKILLTNLDTVIDLICQTIEQIQIQQQSRIEVIGQNAEITQTVEKDVRKTVITKAEKVVIYN
jgi:restriction endonuclease Mrr